MAAGYTAVTWDGTGEDGQRLPGGLYVVRIDAGGERVTRRVVKLD
jgi:flagellar hook assembly protein FlgD